MATKTENGKAKIVSIAAILSSSGYALDIFTSAEVAALEIVWKRENPSFGGHITVFSRKKFPRPPGRFLAYDPAGQSLKWVES